MAKLYFYYSAMNAGKTTTLLQSAYNYHERGMRTLIITPEGKLQTVFPVSGNLSDMIVDEILKATSTTNQLAVKSP